MNAIILAAGRGTRMASYTESRPKGMLELNGKTLIERQLGVLRACHVDRIAIVTGYKPEFFTFKDITYYHNDDYATTNMVRSLMCARDELEDDVLIAYSDLVYSPSLVNDMIAHPGEVALAVDPEWRTYWMGRYGTTETDLETLTLDDGVVVELGSEVESSDGLDYRYVGLIKFSRSAAKRAMAYYDAKEAAGDDWRISGKNFLNGQMTDFLGELIDSGVRVEPVMAAKQWLEFDTPTDYKVVADRLSAGTLGELFDLQGTF